MIRKLTAIFGTMILILISPLVAHAQVIHAVRYGDSLEKISKQYKFPLEEIAKLNGLTKMHTLWWDKLSCFPVLLILFNPGKAFWKSGNAMQPQRNR
ncbi:LysM peptidoglycan-binding domain-containing protein [Effusibacillus dendaii]|uniref:LysM domain-containing protein n=1 Tax=Effusibacillus dendaii TaxID=2743772 RepID=A0A7I8DH27_9BACL|nr:LysM domain-containing protein [Effusibacillus dendaii]BCJ88309.1 hypothetical protein skT53_32940 [Effusibacillus dendaii]